MGEPVSDTNIIHILEKLKTDTEAQATNQGFYYQYLVTLDVWLKNYNSLNNVIIYCETEDDIKVEDLKSNTVEFTQVKAYSKNFNIKSDEVQKSIVNFFQLYNDYKDESPSFIFHTNTAYEGEFFEEIKTLSYKSKISSKVEEILVQKFEEKNNKKLINLKKKMDEANTYISKNPNPKTTQQEKYNRLKTQVEDSIKEKKQIEDDFNTLKIFIKKEIPSFIERIDWKAEKKDKEDSIKIFIESIDREIAKIDGFKLDTSSAYAHLINKVLVASQALNIEDRKLDNQMINNLIQDAKEIDKFKQLLQSAELLPKFAELCEYHEIQIKISSNILNEVQEQRKELQEHREEVKTEFQEIKDILLNKVLSPNNMDSDKHEIIPDDFSELKDNIFLLTTMEEKEKKLIRDRLKIIAENISKKLKPIDIKNKYSILESNDYRHYSNREFWSMYLEFIIISIFFDLCSPIGIDAIEDINKKWKFLFLKTDDWISEKEKILTSDFTLLRKGAIVIIACDGTNRTPTSCFMKSSTLIDIGNGIPPEKFNIAYGVTRPHIDFKFRHIHAIQKQMIDDCAKDDEIFHNANALNIERIIEDEINKIFK